MKNKILIFLFIFNLSAYSQEDSASTSIIETENSQPIQTDDSLQGSLTELDYYKLLAEQSKSNNESFKSLMEWSLGLTFAFLLAIIGSQIFFNYRINKKEVDFIKKDLDEKLAQLKNSYSENIDYKFEKLEKELKIELTKSSIEMKKNLSTNFKSHKEYAALKIEATKTSLKQDLKVLEKEIQKNIGDIWKLKGVESNALSNFIRSAEIDLDLKREVKYILKDIIEILKSLEEIHSRDYESLGKLVDKIKVTHKEKAEEIKKLYLEKPVYEFVQNTGPTSFLMGGFPPQIKYVKNQEKKK